VVYRSVESRRLELSPKSRCITCGVLEWPFCNIHYVVKKVKKVAGRGRLVYVTK